MPSTLYVFTRLLLILLIFHFQAHSSGLKLGLYISLGNATACGYPGMQGFKELDTAQLAAWGVDMVFADAANLDGDGSVITQGYLVPTHYSLTLRPLDRCAIFLLSFAAYEAVFNRQQVLGVYPENSVDEIWNGEPIRPALYLRPQAVLGNHFGISIRDLADVTLYSCAAAIRWTRWTTCRRAASWTATSAAAAVAARVAADRPA